MIAQVGQRAGFSDNQLYYTSDNKSMNAKVKRMVSFKRNSWSFFVDPMWEMEKQQERNIERAVFNEGPYRLKAGYFHLVVNRQDVCRTSQSIRIKAIEKFRKSVLNQTPEQPYVNRHGRRNQDKMRQDLQESTLSLPLSSLLYYSKGSGRKQGSSKLLKIV